MDWFNLDELLRAASLPEVATSLGLPLTSQGASYVVLCPFHTDTRPSLYLYPPNGTAVAHFHCFTCNAHGTAIDLVKQAKSVGFEEAVHWLASAFGVRPEKRGRGGIGHAVSFERRMEARAFVERVYDQANDREAFAEWARTRRYSPEFLAELGLRMISGNPLVQALNRLSLDEQLPLADELEAMGLIVRLRSPRKGESTSYFLPLEEQFKDFFSGRRVVIPIRTTEGRVEGYAGRSAEVSPVERGPKYLLTRGLQKSRYLFNADHAFSDLRERAVANVAEHTLYVVEGFFDALRLRSLGFAAVALMGTSMSHDQYEALQSLVERAFPREHVLTIRLLLDRDAAGLRAGARLVRQMLGLAGVALQWLGSGDEVAHLSGLGEGKDPDECFSHGGLTPALAGKVLDRLAMPSVSVLLLEELGGKSADDLLDARWARLNVYHRDRALLNTVRALRRLSSFVESWRERLSIGGTSQPMWLKELLSALPDGDNAGGGTTSLSESLFLTEPLARRNHARLLAFHGSRRGELPCDEPSWLCLEAGASLFDRMLVERLRSGSSHHYSVAPFESVHLPRKFLVDAKTMADPRRKVMPHPVDLVLQQVLLNELLTERHDYVRGQGKVFSDLIPAVRYYREAGATRVTGKEWSGDEQTIYLSESTLSFAYQVDMEVVEGQRTPSDQGMFRPFGECWRDFMASLSRQAHGIGGRVHVLRLDAKRYYDNISQYVVRDRLLEPLGEARSLVGSEFLKELLGDERAESLENRLVDRICQCLFEHPYRDPDTGEEKRSNRDLGIPQGPVLSAWVGTIAMFSVDAAARALMQRHIRLDSDGWSAPRLGYARYVDDIVLFAESEDLLSTLRGVVQDAAGKLELTLVRKGDPVAPGSPEAVMQYLNEGRNFAASAPAWEPPLTGDGEWGWSLSEDSTESDRQTALRLLRHPGILDIPEAVHEKVREAMLATDLRPGDLGKCTRLLWWQLAMTLPPAPPMEETSTVWDRYWKAWDFVTEGHAWAAEFGRVGYSLLAAIEGLDRLLDMDSWLERGRTSQEVGVQRSRLKYLASFVCKPEFFHGLHAERNRAHLRRRHDLVRWKALRHIDSRVVFIDAQIQGSRSSVTLEQWFCFATASLMALPPTGDGFDPKSALRPLQNRQLSEDPSITPISAQVRELLLAPLLSEDAAMVTSESWRASEESALRDRPAAEDIVRGLLISAAPRERLWEMFGLYPTLLEGREAGLQVLPPLPGIEGAHLLAVIGGGAGNEVSLRAFWVRDDEQSAHRPPAKFWGGGSTPGPAGTSLPQSWNEPPTELTGGLQRWEAAAPLPVVCEFKRGALYTAPGRTAFAATLFRSLYSAQRQVGIEMPGCEVVPVVPHLAMRGAGEDRQWFVLGQAISSKILGATGWVRGSNASLRSVAVPKVYGGLWRIGVAVADALGLAYDVGAEGQQRDGDELLPDLQGIEDYVLRQQLRKLRGQWLSEGGVGADEDGLPRSLERALEILESFPFTASPSAQVESLLKTEAETQAMAMRLADRRREGMRDRLHQLPATVLNRIPLNVLEALPIEASGDTASIQPLSALLAIARSLRARTEGPSARVGPWLALTSALPLSVAAVGLRGLFASLQGLVREPMPERYSLPSGWPEPDGLREDPQAAYGQIRRALQDDDWPELSHATPWQWMLAVLAILGKFLVRNDFGEAANELLTVYKHLHSWETAILGEGAQAWAWPFEDLPQLTSDLHSGLAAMIDDLPRAVAAVESALGLVVTHEAGPAYGRNRRDDAFKDARGRHWRLRKGQYTELGQVGREGVASFDQDQERLVTWTEVRNRRQDDQLLSVHVVDGKLARWVGLGRFADVASGEPQLQRRDVSTVGAAALEVRGEVPSVSEDPLAEASRPAHTSSERRKVQGGDTARPGLKKDGCFRVALFQWRVDESYSHPLLEAGLSGLGMKSWHKDKLRALLDSTSHLAVASDACGRGREHLWAQTAQVVSWPEYRRRRLLSQMLEQCKRLNVDLLVLPEYSVRRETIDWLAKTLEHSPGLAVLAGTYRCVNGRVEEYLASPLTLLWQPTRDVAKALLGKENPDALCWKRGKKYRAVAVNELFRPQWENLAPLFRPENLLESFRYLKGFEDSRISSLIQFIAKDMPALQHCMELICSELFMLTSPANLLPLQREVAELLSRFPGSGPVDGDEIVRQDYWALAELLDIGHKHSHARRSILLVPAATSRTNDYWYAGQAAVLASATATVFCNAVLGDLFKGGSCFIGADSTSFSKESPGIVDKLTPYHGWSKGIHLGRSGDALSDKDQAMVVADLDPVHVVGGKPRPQLLPHPMCLVAYLPVVELIEPKANALAVRAELSRLHSTPADIPINLFETIQSSSKRKLKTPSAFKACLDKLESVVKDGRDIEGDPVEDFADSFSDPDAVRARLLFWQRDRVQQPHVGQLSGRLPPALRDFIQVDLTLNEGQELPLIEVPNWCDDARSSLVPDGD